jgi:hypothetical protein
MNKRPVKKTQAAEDNREATENQDTEMHEDGDEQAFSTASQDRGTMKGDILTNITHDVLAAGMANLDLRPETVKLGENLITSLTDSNSPFRRTFKAAPGLTGAGVAAIAVGGVLLGIAIEQTSGALSRRVLGRRQRKNDNSDSREKSDSPHNGAAPPASY